MSWRNVELNAQRYTSMPLMDHVSWRNDIKGAISAVYIYGEEVIELPKCEKCGKEYELGRKDKAIRAMNVQLIGSISKLAPGLGDGIGEKAKTYCTDCWRTIVNETNKQMMRVAQGKMAEAEEIVKKEKAVSGPGP